MNMIFFISLLIYICSLAAPIWSSTIGVPTKSRIIYSNSLRDHLATKHRKSNNISIANSSLAPDLDHRFPNAIIIGVKKAGTRALLEYLKLNPMIRGTGPEIHFFDRHYQRGYDWYRSQMPISTQNQLTIEKTPSYYVTRDVPKRIAKFNPNIKLLVVVRNPVERALSDYAQTSSKRQMHPFEHLALRKNQKSDSIEVNSRWNAIRLGLYSKYLDRWLEYFPLEQMMFVSGEALVNDPAGETNRVERFLGLVPYVTDSLFVNDPEKHLPCLRKNPMGAPRCLGKTKGRKHPEISHQLRTKLEHFYKGQNEMLYKKIGKTFSWQ